MKTFPRTFRLASLLSVTLLLCACAGPRAAPPNERQAKAMAMWQERCKTAGEKIYKRVEGVEGVFLMKVRPEGVNFDSQFKMDDPFGADFWGDGYVKSFLRGRSPSSKIVAASSPPHLAYRYVEAVDPKDGQRYRYTGGVRAVRKKDITAPGVQWELKRNPNYDLNIYDFVLDKAPATGLAPRYGVTYDDISTQEERDYWIAGSSLRVVDLQTNEVVAERIGYMVDWAQGSQAGERSPWLFAADNACPIFASRHGTTEQPGQTERFVKKVLKPILEK